MASNQPPTTPLEIEKEEGLLGPSTPPQGSQRRRPWLRWALFVLLFPVLLVLLVGVALYLPPVQKVAVEWASKQASKATGWKISLGELHLGFPLEIRASEVLALSEQGDTIAYLDGLRASVPVAPLLNGSIPISSAKIRGAKVNFWSEDSLFSIRGYVDTLALKDAQIDLKGHTMSFDEVLLASSSVSLFYADTTTKKVDTLSAPSPWVFHLKRGELSDIHFDMATSPDSLLIDIDLHRGQLAKANVNLPEAYYEAQKISLEGALSKIGTQIEYLPLPWTVSAEAREVHYDSLNVRGVVDQASFFLSEGWGIKQIAARINKDPHQLEVKDLEVILERSSLNLEGVIPMNGWLPDSLGETSLEAKGLLFAPDFEHFIGKGKEWPDNLISLDLKGKGRMQDKIDLSGKIQIHEVLSLDLAGRGTNIMSPKKSQVRLDFHATTGDVMPHLHLFGLKEPTWKLPEGIFVDGEIHYTPQKIDLETLIQTQSGHLKAQGDYRPKSLAYNAVVDINDIDLGQFLPHDSIGLIRGQLTAIGKGTDPFSPKTHTHIDALIDTIVYKGTGFRKISLLSELKEQQFFAALNSENTPLNLTAQVDATLQKENVVGSINVFVDTIIPNKLGLNIGFLEGASLELRSNLRSDLKEYFDFSGEIENCTIGTDKNIIRPPNIYLSAQTSSDSVRAKVTSGDLSLNMLAQNGLKDFQERLSRLSEDISTFSSDTTGTLNLVPFIEHYPTMDLSLSMGRANPLRSYLDEHRIGWRNLKMNLGTTTQEGLSGDLYITHFQADTFRIDEMDLVLRQDTSFFYAIASMHKERFRNQQPFNAMASLTTNVHRSEVFVSWKDQNEEEFVQLGVEAKKTPSNDFTFSFTPDPPILAYNKFLVVGENYITLPHENRSRIKGNLKLVSDDGAEIALRDSTTTQGHTLFASIKDFGLSKIKGLSFIPDIEGIVTADAHWNQSPQGKNDYTIEAQIEGFKYDKASIGNLKVSGFMQEENKGQYASGDLFMDDEEVAKLEAFIPKEKGQSPRWHAVLNNLQLEKANPFLPKEYAVLAGLVEADLGNYDTSQKILSTSTGKINGTIALKNASVFVPILNESYLLEEKPIRVKNDRLIFDQLTLTSNNNNARLVTQGFVTLSNKMNTQLNIRGKDMLLLDSKPTSETMLYGTIGADADIKLRGPLQTLAVTGNVSIKGNTNLTYTLKDNPLENRNKFSGLVEFEDFSDTLFVAKNSPLDSLSLGGMDIRLGINIDPAVRATALLSSDESNKVYVQGGGNLNFTFPPYGTMSLQGTYEINNGYVSYSFPPIIKQKFTIDNNSKLVWSGDVMNPNISFKATGIVRADATPPGEATRKVNFNVSIVAKNNVNDLSLRFTADAPEDLSLRNSFLAMTDEERSWNALVLLTTRRFVGGQSPNTMGNTGYMNQALSSMVAGQLNNLMGEALNADINLGVEELSPEQGGGMNYSYSIAKRFYNDRINVTVGGRVETGSASSASGMNQSFIDNVSIDYRLDQAGTHYMRLFHKKNYENLLDGEVIETGAGYVIRRRLNRLRDLFNFKTQIPIPTLTPKVTEEAKLDIEDPEKPKDDTL